jgi:ABC-type antimicrobial peptide transport system permease subunit
MHVVIRSDLPLATLGPTVRGAVRAIDPSLPIVELQSMDDVVGSSLRRPRMLMHLFGAFAGVALLLAAIGTYGVLSYLVAQRRREIGIRMALGANRKTILRGVMAHGLLLALIGIAIGQSAAVVLTRLMQTLLFDVSPSDPVNFVGVAALMIIVAAVASLLPAIRATQVDPIVVLRDE